MKSRISEELKTQYAGLFLLTYMKENGPFSVLLENDKKVLEPILKWMLESNYVDIDEKNFYQVTGKGEEIRAKFQKRYEDFLDSYDVFCAVDLQEGEFALAYYHEYDNPEEWQEFLSQDRWEDLRVAVAEHKGIDPVEIIFMSCVEEGSFGYDDEGFQYDLLLGKIWDVIEDIFDRAIRLKSLAYEDRGEIVSSRSVIEDIIQSGQDLIDELRHDSV